MAFDRAGVVGHAVATRVCERRRAACRCGTSAASAPPICRHAAGRADAPPSAFERVGHRQREQAADGSFRQAGIDQPIDPSGWTRQARGVVDQDPVVGRARAPAVRPAAGHGRRRASRRRARHTQRITFEGRDFASKPVVRRQHHQRGLEARHRAERRSVRDHRAGGRPLDIRLGPAPDEREPTPAQGQKAHGSRRREAGRSCEVGQARAPLNWRSIRGPPMQSPSSRPGALACPAPSVSADALLLAQFAQAQAAAEGADWRSSPPSRRTQRLEGRTGLLRARAAHRRLPGLGDAALRHLFAASGPDLGAARDAVADPGGSATSTVVLSATDGAGARLAPPSSWLPTPSSSGRSSARRSGAEGAAHAGRLHHVSQVVAGRIRGARRADRPVPDGLAGALPRRPVRRRGRSDPHLRPDSQRSLYPVPEVRLLPGREFPWTRRRALAFARAGARSSRATRPRCASTRTWAAASPPPASSTTCPLLRADRDHLRLPRRPAATLALHGEVDEALMRFWADTRERHRFLQHDKDKPILPPEEIFLRSEDFSAGQCRTRRWCGAVPNWSRARPLPDLSVDRGAPGPLARLEQACAAPHAAPRAGRGRERGAGARACSSCCAINRIEPPSVASTGRIRERRRRHFAIGTGAAGRGLLLAWSRQPRADDPVRHRDGALRHRAERAAQAAPGAGQRRRRADRGTSELNVGDPVVHVNHGIGATGLINIDLGDGPASSCTSNTPTRRRSTCRWRSCT